MTLISPLAWFAATLKRVCRRRRGVGAWSVGVLMLLGISGCQVDMLAWLAAQWANPCPSQQTLQDDMLYQINQFRQQSQYCAGQYYPAVERVTWQAELTQAAQTHSADMGRFQFVAHQGSDGSSAQLRVTWAGYLAANLDELLAMDVNDTRDALAYWQQQQEGCAAIMNPHYQHLGAACEENWDNGRKTYWSILLAAPKD